VQTDTKQSESEQTPIRKHSAPWLQPWHFKPGQSGNPSGRPRKITNEMERLAKRKKEAKALARAMFDQAQDTESPRSVAAANLILERVEGPIVQKVETTSVNLNLSLPEQESAMATLALLRGTTTED